MAVTVQNIRDAINIPEEHELSDDVIESAISRGEGYINVLKARYSAPAEFFATASINYCAYLAYQAYADRVLNVHPGQYESGQWNPITEEIYRSTGDKLAGLRRISDDIIGIIRSYPTRPLGTFHHGTLGPRRFSIGQFDYSDTKDVFSVRYHD